MKIHTFVISNAQILLIILLIKLILSYLLLNKVMDYDFYVNLFSKEGYINTEAIKKMFSLQQKFTWLIYLEVVVFFLLKIVFVLTAIRTTGLLRNISITTYDGIRIVLLSESIMLVSGIMNIVLLLNYGGDINPTTLFSLIGVFPNVAETYNWLYFAMSKINVFEVLYGLLISWFLYKKNKNLKLVDSLKIGLFGYGAFMILFLLMITLLFLTL